ncbi:MAG: D-alanyl-D-alanine carboxypeptidase family protein [Syntrophomonadaceae bacterium]|nr:D-alanyl-D-alanine carboxypeptidase family protein [Syntrophomonadaceae bacterium]
MMKRKLRFIAVIVCLSLWLPAGVQAAPRLSSQYYCVVDRETGQCILGQNAAVKRPMASTTKMMTAILAVEYAGLDETAVVSSNADRTPEYTIGLRAGQRITVSELLKAALIRSANDAAVVLAEYVAGDEQLFAYLMSKKACLIGAPNTRFQNASGLPADNHYSTAYDLAQIGRYALTKPYIDELVGTASTLFQHPGYQQPLTINNTNAGLLTGYPGADGIKTGTTDAAGKCLVASAVRKDRGLITVVLKSGDRLGDTVKLLNYGFNEATHEKIIDHAEIFKTLSVNNSDESAAIVPAEDLWLWMGDKSAGNIEKRVRLNYNLDAPLKQGEVLGEMDLYMYGFMVRSVALVNLNEVDRKDWFIQRIIKHIISLPKRNNTDNKE